MISVGVKTMRLVLYVKYNAPMYSKVVRSRKLDLYDIKIPSSVSNKDLELSSVSRYTISPMDTTRRFFWYSTTWKSPSGILVSCGASVVEPGAISGFVQSYF